jgi:TusA-related sulfurtransferase
MPETLDLRGVRCPLNWAKAKVRLEALPRGTDLALLLDDPKGVRDIPRAAEAEGYAVLDVEPLRSAWRIVIRT